MTPAANLVLQESNYYSPEADIFYMSASQYKSFLKCEAAALAKIKGEAGAGIGTKEMLIGSYVDAALLGGLEEFKEQEDGSALFTKSGELRAEFKQAEQLVERIRRDEMFMRYLGGEHQKIVCGEIAGVPFKGKIDAYHIGRAIVDLKTCASFSRIWSDAERTKIPFIEAWGYDTQLAIYQWLAQDLKARCFIAAITKEKEPDIAIMEIPQERLDFCLSLVGQNAPRFQAIKRGEIPPVRCEKCDYCRSTKVLRQIVDYRNVA